MKRLFFVVCALSILAPTVAAADETCEAGFQCLKPITIYGRAPKPIMVIDLKHESAASAANEAHESMRAEWIKQLEPKTLRPSQQQ